MLFGQSVQHLHDSKVRINYKSHDIKSSYVINKQIQCLVAVPGLHPFKFFETLYILSLLFLSCELLEILLGQSGRKMDIAGTRL